MDKNLPAVTAVIPTFRRPELLRRAITSILRQTYREFQIIVYDNASGDETADVVHELATGDSRVKYICHDENIGVLNNFQHAMLQIQTPYFSILSDDDLVLPDFYQTALTAFDANPEAMFVATRVVSMDLSGNIYPMPELTAHPGYYEPPEGLTAMLRHGHPTWTGILFRGRLVSALGGLDQATGAASDLDFELRAAAHYPFVAVDKVCAVFSTHESSITSSARLDSTWPGWLKLIENMDESGALDENTRRLAREILTERLRNRLITIAIGSLVRENFDDAGRAIDILDTYFGTRQTAQALRAMAFAAGKSHIFLAAITILNSIRRTVRIRNMKKSGNLQPETLTRLSDALDGWI